MRIDVAIGALRLLELNVFNSAKESHHLFELVAIVLAVKPVVNKINQAMKLILISFDQRFNV